MAKDENTLKNLEKNLSMSGSASKPSEYYELDEEDKDAEILERFIDIDLQLHEYKQRLELNHISEGLSQIDSVIADVSRLKLSLDIHEAERQLESLEQQLQHLDIGRRSSSRLSEEDEKAAKLERFIDNHVETEANHVFEPRTPMDIRGLCANQGLELVKFQTGISYEYVEPATQHIPVFSIEFGYGIHLNFFARQQTGPPTSSLPELMFLEFALGDPVEVVRCVPLGDQKYSYPHENECVCFHPDDDEPCGYCENAKDGSLTRNYALPPPYPIHFP